MSLPEPKERLRSPVGLLALQSLPRIGPITALRIALGAPPPAAAGDRFWSKWKAALSRSEEEIDELSGLGIRTLSIFDAAYPARLRAIHDPPPVLFVNGAIDELGHEKLIAIVGTREPSKFGCSATEEITGLVADDGWTVVSGLAKGVDTLAHGATLKHHATTIAVLAGGLDTIYPAENRELAMAIVDQGGALVSEHRNGVRPHRSSFVDRNRIQTGLSVAVVVTQTGITGGTMHTVRHAAAQGRPIFCAVPNSDNPKNAGLRVLLEEPANTLWKRLPAWKGEKALCRRLGEQPLARPLRRNGFAEFLDILGRLSDEGPPIEAGSAEAELFARKQDGSDSESSESLFAFVD